MTRFFVEVFLSRRTEKLCRGTLLLLCFRKILPLAKIFKGIRGGSVNNSPSKTFLSNSSEKIRRRTVQSVTYFRVSKKFMLQTVMSRFFVGNFFVSQNRKIS